MKLRTFALVAALLGLSGAQAATVTYTFTGTAHGPTGDATFQLSRTLSDYLDVTGTQTFALADVTTDPWGAGNTLVLNQCASDAAPTFGYVFGFVTFGGACFWNDLAASDSSNQFSVVSTDINVGFTDQPGTWYDNAFSPFAMRLDITVNDDAPTGDVPEPASLSLLAAALAGAGVARRYRQRKTR